MLLEYLFQIMVETLQWKQISIQNCSNNEVNQDKKITRH